MTFSFVFLRRSLARIETTNEHREDRQRAFVFSIFSAIDSAAYF
jgi:hypothetical protein